MCLMFPDPSSIPLSVYIHLPWCVQKCPYCDFNSHAVRGTLPEEAYIAALLSDFKEAYPLLNKRPVCSIFLGGGTPSLFSAHGVGQILNGIHQQTHFDPDIEITLEANPGTVDSAAFSGFRAAGINRLSIGIQSLQDDKLKQLGRIHGRLDALKAIETAKKAGFDNFNLDLMHGLPGQTAEDAEADLLDALATDPTHLSWYQLTLEPNTLFHARPPILPDEDTLHSIQSAGQSVLNQAGFTAYEVSAWARDSRHCLHNRNYWEFGDYLGIGAGAHSKLTTENASLLRRAQCKHPTDYLNATKRLAAKWQRVPETEIAFEFMLNALRLTEGVPARFFEERTGLPLSSIAEPLAEAHQKNLLRKDPTHLCASALGQQFLNDLTALFLPA